MKKPSGKNRARPAGGGDLKAKLEKYGITFDTLSMSHGISKYSWLIAWVSSSAAPARTLHPTIRCCSVRLKRCLLRQQSQRKEAVLF
jgi:hypothetical protein